MTVTTLARGEEAPLSTLLDEKKKKNCTYHKSDVTYYKTM